MHGFSLRNMLPADRDAVSRLIFHSTNEYYISIGRSPIFSGDDLSAGIFFDVYEKTDPGQGIVAVNDSTSEIIGSCFVHPRETHISLGIMNAHHDHFGRGVARTILQQIVDLGRQAGKPVRLVSSCFNLDSYSLYTRQGFVPYCTYQDMILNVPESGLAADPPEGNPVRTATVDDIEAIAAIEKEVSGIARAGDYRYFLENEQGIWHVSVVVSPEGVAGYLVSCGAETFNMLGPGVARTEDQAAALLHAELNCHPGRSPVFLVPVTYGSLVQRLYTWGARNCEMHVGQSTEKTPPPQGVTMPTFLPETG